MGAYLLEVGCVRVCMCGCGCVCMGAYLLEVGCVRVYVWVWEAL